MFYYFLFGFDPPAPVSWMLAEHSLVDSLENFRLLNLSRVAPVAWMLARFLFFRRARFAIAAMQAVELKWLILNKVNK